MRNNNPDQKNFSNLCRLQKVVNTARTNFIEYLERTWKYESTDEIPDRIVEVVDYGNGRMTFKEMGAIMDQFFERRARQSIESVTDEATK